MIRMMSVLTLAAVLATSGPTSAEEKETPIRGGTLNSIVHPEPPILSPLLNTATPIVLVATKINDGLVDYALDGSLKPQLAESWDFSKDGLTLTFKLRKGVTWHDGHPFTSADVKFSIEEGLLKYSSTGKRIFQALSKVETPDEQTVILTLSKPTPVIYRNLNAQALWLLPKHLYEGTDVRSNPWNAKPIGTGPFVFKEYVRGSHIALDRNPNYWDAGKPYLDRIVFKIIPDAAGRAAAFETGAVQFGQQHPITFADADRLKKDGRFVVDTRGYEFSPTWFWLEPNLKNQYLQHLKVRQAIAQAIDRNLLLKTVWGGYGKVAVSPIPSSLRPFHLGEGLQQYPFDPKKAEQLLDEAGFPRKDGGWRFKLTHDFIPYGDDYRRTGEFVRQSLRRVGIDVTLGSQDLTTWLKSVFTDYNFDLISSWGGAGADPQMGIETRFWSKARMPGTSWVAVSGYQNDELDAAVEDAQTQIDPQKRVEDYNTLQRIVQRDLPLIPLFEIDWFSVYDKRLHGLTNTPNQRADNFANVYFAPE
ncbi:ABC transporter substrate-binding protein [Bradyrhizobium sp. 61]|uniref:ABC transporter substrate-binding protein n=1 Tax=Bradyrhizobium sp. 61 TaxID=2782679 RepID=UPI001FFA9988|nr:ABC transporter substrate-binding protein [Bradyrhizobium sp. 61]